MLNFTVEQLNLCFLFLIVLYLLRMPACSLSCLIRMTWHKDQSLYQNHRSRKIFLQVPTINASPAQEIFCPEHYSSITVERKFNVP